MLRTQLQFNIVWSCIWRRLVKSLFCGGDLHEIPSVLVFVGRPASLVG